MTKIFTIGFSGKSPDAFLDVLNATRISCVWDIRQWRLSTYVPYYNGDNLANGLGLCLLEVMNNPFNLLE